MASRLRTNNVNPINASQQLILECIKAGSFNEFDGEAAVNLLIDSKDLWDAVIFSDERCGALLLRDLTEDSLHLDALYILTTQSRHERLLERLKVLAPNEMSLIETKDDYSVIKDAIYFCLISPSNRVDSDSNCVIRCWWD